MEKSRNVLHISNSGGPFFPQSHVHNSQVKEDWIYLLKIRCLQGKGLVNGEKTLGFQKQLFIIFFLVLRFTEKIVNAFGKGLI